jgi:DASS family divalent anion:Na+ symporter
MHASRQAEVVTATRLGSIPPGYGENQCIDAGHVRATLPKANELTILITYPPAVDPRATVTPHTAPEAALRRGPLALVVCIGIAIWLLPRPEPVDPRAWRLLAIFVATIAGLIVKPLPMGAVTFLGMAVALATRTLTLPEALSGFANSTAWLIVTAFLIAAGFIRTGLGERIAYGLVALFGRSTLGLGYSLVASDLVLAPMIPSNTARAGGVVYPILQSLAKTTINADTASDRQARAFLTLVAYNGTVITSAMFLTSMVGNPLVAQLAADQGITISWGLWALAACVPGAVSLIAVPPLIYWLCARGVSLGAGAPAVARAALARLGPMKRTERIMATISLVLLAAWILAATIQVDPTAAALMAVAALLLTGVLTWDVVAREHEAWNTFVWFSTILVMALFLGQLGLIKWFTSQVRVLFDGVGWVSGFTGLVLVYFYTHYFFAASTAKIGAMYAPFLAAAIAIGTPPILAALVLGFSSNLCAGLTHFGTAPGPILFGSGYVPLSTWWKVGLAVSVVNIVIWVGIGAAWWRVLGLW